MRPDRDPAYHALTCGQGCGLAGGNSFIILPSLRPIPRFIRHWPFVRFPTIESP